MTRFNPVRTDRGGRGRGPVVRRETENVTLALRANRFLSTGYVAEENGTVVAELHRSRWRARADMTLQGRTLKLTKRGLFRDAFTLSEGGATITTVEQPRVFRSRLVFRFDGREFVVRRKAWYGETLVVATGEAVVGRILWRGLFRSGALVDLPGSLPISLRVFLGWIAMVRWEESRAK